MTRKTEHDTGAVISYSVKENKLNYSNTDYSAEYSSSVARGEYTVGAHHTGDTDPYTFTNKLSGSVTPGMQTAEKTADVTPATGAVSAVTWTDLPRYQYTGDVTKHHTYFYRVVETQTALQADVFDAPAYSTSDISGAGTDSAVTVFVTNALKTVQVDFKKAWNDSENAFGTRPDSITLQVESRLGTGKWNAVAGKTAVVTSASGWTHSFTGLLKYTTDGTTEFEYRVVETKLTYGTTDLSVGADGTAGAYQSAQTDNLTVTNTLKTTSLTVSKEWDDTDNLYHTRPASDLTVALQSKESTGWTAVLKDDKAVTGTLTYDPASKTWSPAEFDDLPAADKNGKPYEYQAVETTPVTNYQSASLNSDPAHIVITNTLISVSIAGTKAWTDYADKYKTRPQDGKLAVTVSDQNGALNPQPAVVWSVKDDSTCWQDAGTGWRCCCGRTSR